MDATLEFSESASVWPKGRKELIEAIESGRVNGRVIRRGPRKLHGFWLRVAAAIYAGASTDAEIAASLGCRPIDANRAVYNMLRLKHLHRSPAGALTVTGRTKRSLVEERLL